MEKNKTINTLESIKEQKTDTKLQSEQFRTAQGISKGPRRKFECKSVYSLLYPDGFMTTYQGIIIELVFDNRIVELPEVVVEFLENKFKDKADREAMKTLRFEKKKQEKLGEYQAAE